MVYCGGYIVCVGNNSGDSGGDSGGGGRGVKYPCHQYSGRSGAADTPLLLSCHF